jgi:hypothetical protein
MTAGDIKITTGMHSDYMSGVVVNGADDYIQIDALAAAEALATNVKGAISAWINIPDITTSSYCVFALGDNDAVEHIELMVTAGKLRGYCIDGGVLQWDVVSTTTTLTPHQWHHVCLVHDSVRPYLYLDGVALAMTDTDATDLTEWTNGLTGLDKGAIGILVMNGTTTLDFKGGIAYVKYATEAATAYNTWSANDVLQEYNYRGGYGTGTGVTKGVLCTWTLNGNCTETTTGGGTYDGTIVSDVQYDSEYSQLTSKLRLLAPVVADDICLMATGMSGGVTAVVVKAA